MFSFFYLSLLFGNFILAIKFERLSGWRIIVSIITAFIPTVAVGLHIGQGTIKPLNTMDIAITRRVLELLSQFLFFYCTIGRSQ
ncbi:hypothetical protein D3C75_1240570 [compost metagenome]